MDTPFNILKTNGEEILKKAGIKDWEEDLQHLRNQLLPSQVGACDGFDFRQKKRDERVRVDQERKVRHQQQELQRLKEIKVDDATAAENDDDETDVEELDEEFKSPNEKKAKMIDVMGPISMTADARGLSIRDRTALAAAVVNAVGLDIRKTNVNVTSACTLAQKRRISITKEVKENFTCPEEVSLHFDSKIFKVEKKWVEKMCFFGFNHPKWCQKQEF